MCVCVCVCVCMYVCTHMHAVIIYQDDTCSYNSIVHSKIPSIYRKCRKTKISKVSINWAIGTKKTIKCCVIFMA